MSGPAAAAKVITRVIPWQVITRATPKALPKMPKEIDYDDLGKGAKEAQETIRRLDDPPADPTPPKPKPKSPIGDLDQLPDPELEPQPEDQTWRTDPKTCTITRPSNRANTELMTQVCIAGNVAQAMTEAYNRGYATGRAVSKKWKLRCPRSRDDSAWLNKRLKRIILSQDNPQVHRRVVTSRKA